MLFVAGDKELGLSSKRGPLDDTVVVIFRRNNSDALRGFNQPSKRANEPNTRSRRSSLNPNFSRKIRSSSARMKVEVKSSTSPRRVRERIWVWLCLLVRKAKAEIRTLVSRTIRIGGVDYLRTS